MSPDDLRLTAQLVAAGRVHCVSDASVMAMARRVLELEGEVERWVIAANQYRFHQTTEAAVAAEREACALVCFDVAAGTNQTPRKLAAQDCGVLIRERGGQ